MERGHNFQQVILSLKNNPDLAYTIKLAALCALVFFVGQSFAQSHRAADTPEVSLVRLIANPEKYDGKYIRIEGLAYFDSEHYINGIFLSREDREMANGRNAIFVTFSPSIRDADHLNNQFVLAQGVFRANDRGHLSAFASTLADVDRVEAVRPLVR